MMIDANQNQLIVPSQENIELIRTRDKCDKYDYLIAVGCGAIGGLVDIFLVGAPGDSILGQWTDTMVDKSVMSFAKLCGWEGNGIKSAIGFLENGSAKSRKNGFSGFKVNYDQRHSGDVDGAFSMSAKNHHMKSLAHSPDIIGLFFSILNQFTSTSSFIANGKLITIDTENFELYGSNPVTKIFCGVANWFGHLMSDVAGSSGAVGRGSGIVMPFYELFQFCTLGKFKVGKDKQDLATIATRAFQEGYDLRHGLAMSIPVLITDLSIRLVWALRQRFQFHLPIKECIPNGQHENLRVMLLVGNGTLCVMDVIDAGVRSGGNALVMFTRLNLVAWYRLVKLVLKEVCIRLGLNTSLDDTIASFKRVNEAIAECLLELEKIDIALFKKETERYNQMVFNLEYIADEESLNAFLLNAFDELHIEKPWDGDFDDFMSDKNNRLVFG